ncbi:hypothetical protein [Modestobacter sp. NPDC049651]|uniref:hypothetical protein n=1 Tax=unclassified Modestobacter TaxID=2643866 RepID=UPI0033E16CD5
MRGAGVLVVLGLGAVVVGLWPGVVSARLTGGGQLALFTAGLALLVWGGTWLVLAAGREAEGDGNDSNTGSNPGARTAGPPPTLGR